MKSYKILIIFIIASINAAAQGIDPGLPGGDPDVPIDGGVGFLIAAGIAYGVKKLRDTKP